MFTDKAPTTSEEKTKCTPAYRKLRRRVLLLLWWVVRIKVIGPRQLAAQRTHGARLRELVAFRGYEQVEGSMKRVLIRVVRRRIHLRQAWFELCRCQK